MYTYIYIYIYIYTKIDPLLGGKESESESGLALRLDWKGV